MWSTCRRITTDWFCRTGAPDNYADAMALDNLENVSPEGNIMDLAPLDPYASLYFSICG